MFEQEEFFKRSSTKDKKVSLSQEKDDEPDAQEMAQEYNPSAPEADQMERVDETEDQEIEEEDDLDLEDDELDAQTLQEDRHDPLPKALPMQLHHRSKLFDQEDLQGIQMAAAIDVPVPPAMVPP